MNNIQIEKLKIVNKGFTLIELLVVIAVLGILAVGLVGAINPLDKLNSSSDAKVLNDMGTVARAAESFAVANNGGFPKAAADMAGPTAEIKSIPIAPSGYATYVYTSSPAACTTAAQNCISFTFIGQLKSSKYVGASPSTPRAIYDSLNGKLCYVPATSTNCP